MEQESTDTAQINWRDYIDIPSTVNERTGQDHAQQRAFVETDGKRIVIRAGRRGGKTFGIGIKALQAFAEGKRVLYTAPTADQIDAFWFVIKQACRRAIDAKLLHINNSSHYVEVPNTKIRIRAKTAWNADTLRGDYGDLLIFDEYQLTSEDAWERVGAPMLMDNNGDAVFIYTPPSLHSRSTTKARDPLHASKMFKKAQQDDRWETYHFSSLDNPHISQEAVEEVAKDMTALAYRQEILAEDIDEAPGALWTRALLDQQRLNRVPDGVTLTRVAVGVDPPGGATECGIVTAALGSDGNGYVLHDDSTEGSPDTWSSAVITAYYRSQTDRVVGEKNYGGDMVEHTIRTAKGGQNISYKNVTATRGKALRAEPIAAQYERGKVFHVGTFDKMEAEMVGWQPNSNMPSPNRLDALVWVLTELMLDYEEAVWGDKPDWLQDYRGY